MSEVYRNAAKNLQKKIKNAKNEVLTNMIKAIPRIEEKGPAGFNTEKLV